MKIRIFAALLLTLSSISLSAFALAVESALTAPVLLNADEARRFCLETWFPRLALGQGDLLPALDKLMELYTDDVELVDPNNTDLFGTPVARGKRLVRRYYQSVLQTYPNWTFEILAIYPTESGFVLRYAGKNAPPVARFEGADIIELKKIDGSWKISRLMGYYDRKPFAP